MEIHVHDPSVPHSTSHFFVRFHSPVHCVTLWIYGEVQDSEWLANTPGDSDAADVCSSTLSE